MKITMPMSALILTGAFGLSACGSKDAAPTPAAEPPPAAAAPEAPAASAPDASAASAAPGEKEGGGDHLKP